MQVLETKDYPDFEAFFADFTAEWYKKWEDVFSADATGRGAPAHVMTTDRPGRDVLLHQQEACWLFGNLHQHHRLNGGC